MIIVFRMVLPLGTGNAFGGRVIGGFVEVEDVE